MPTRLKKTDRSYWEVEFARLRWDTFYHSFPLLYAMSEAGPPMMFNMEAMTLELPESDVMFPPIRQRIRAKRIWVAPTKPTHPANCVLYDINYIYDLNVTLAIKNLRKNVARFEKEHPEAFYDKAQSVEDTLPPVVHWYGHSGRQQLTDFGYTKWLTLHHSQFPDLHADVVKIGDKPVCFSLWGPLRDGMAVHLICKDTGIPYLQDYARYMTYQTMLDKGYQSVNDGSDCNIDGIRIYKLKMRPAFIIPIWSWFPR